MFQQVTLFGFAFGGPDIGNHSGMVAFHAGRDSVEEEL
jgi:hypothetical protein